MDACDYVFRHAGGLLIEWPDLDIPPGATGYRWIATLWPENLASCGWALDEWPRARRGWVIPEHLAVGDLIEFGAAYTTTTSSACDLRWYAWLRYATDVALVVAGPYPNPATAWADASRRSRRETMGRTAHVIPRGANAVHHRLATAA